MFFFTSLLLRNQVLMFKDDSLGCILFFLLFLSPPFKAKGNGAIATGTICTSLSLSLSLSLAFSFFHPTSHICLNLRSAVRATAFLCFSQTALCTHIITSSSTSSLSLSLFLVLWSVPFSLSLLMAE